MISPPPRELTVPLDGRSSRAYVGDSVGVGCQSVWNALGLTETGFVGLSSNYTELV